MLSRTQDGLAEWIAPASPSSALLGFGLPDTQIETAGICTYTRHEDFFSARRLEIKSGRMLSGIMINP